MFAEPPAAGRPVPRSHINMSLAKVRGQLDNDAQATHDLLVALEHQGRVQAVSSSVGLFFVADRDARMATSGCHQAGIGSDQDCVARVADD